jgi:hypothetical protein
VRLRLVVITPQSRIDYRAFSLPGRQVKCWIGSGYAPPTSSHSVEPSSGTHVSGSLLARARHCRTAQKQEAIANSNRWPKLRHGLATRARAISFWGGRTEETRRVLYCRTKKSRDKPQNPSRAQPGQRNGVADFLPLRAGCGGHSAGSITR